MALLGGFILLAEYARALVVQVPGAAVPALVLGGVALAFTAWGFAPASLGLGTSRMAMRVLGGLALGVVLVLPTAARVTAVPLLPPALAIAAIAVSIGEEIAFRGALFAALEEAGGPGLAVIGTTALWTAAHALSHPAEFLVPVAAAGLLLGIWRMACRDLVAPIIGHVLADLAL